MAAPAEKWTSISEPGTVPSMGRRALILAVVLSVLLPHAAFAARGARGARSTARTVDRSGRAPAKRSAARASSLAEAKAEMAALLRDKHRRRYHHNWEKAIVALVRAGR